jgi:hypothetical protein
MDVASVKSLRAIMTLHFAVIAVLTAILVSYGSGSAFLPLFILVVCVAAFVLVDMLERFALDRVGVFIGMTIGTAYAVSSYLYNTFWQPSESGQMQAIAGLLIFPEAVLFMQRKNLRVFEQLAIFLLLEIMVAALVNDNLLFGLLLLPIVLLWVSSLFHFSRYATLVHIAPNIEVPMPKLAEILYARFIKRILGDEKPKPIIESKLLTSDETRMTSPRRRIFQSIPLGVGAILFSALFFYCLPRTTAGGYRPKLGKQVRVGLPSTMTLGQVGRALQDPTPVMRLKLTDEKTNNLYPIAEGPYIRARVYDRFTRFADSTRWYLAPSNFVNRPIPEFSRLDVDATQQRDRVRVEFDLLPSCQTDTFTLPPTYSPRGSRIPNGKIGLYTQLLQTEQRNDDEEHHMQAYTLGSTAYVNGRQLDITPILPARGPGDLARLLREHLQHLVNFNPADFPSVDKLRTRILREANATEGNSLSIAKSIERFFAESGEFKYTLDLTASADTSLDPVEDFVASHRAGHCQFFAATMLIMLRQSAIPSRLVLGYKPREFNSIGNYFHVRQQDAHAWVEARFNSRELVGTSYEPWITPNSDYWIRFDPTPGEATESVVEQPNRIRDYADKLWKGYVLEGRELTGENSIYAPTTEKSKDIYANLAFQWQQLKKDLVSGKFGTEGGGINFAWPLAILVTGVGLAAILLWQLVVYLPKVAPKFAKRIGLRPRRSDFNQEFFSRCVRILQRFGFERDESQTPQELTREAADYLEREKGVAASSEWLHLLTQTYYRLRFGSGRALNEKDQAEIQAALKSLEKSAAQLPPSNR